MRIMYAQHWSPSELGFYRQLAFENVLDGMQKLLIAMRDDLHIDVANENVVSAIGKSRLRSATLSDFGETSSIIFRLY